MTVRLLFLLFAIVLAAFGCISLLTGQRTREGTPAIRSGLDLEQLLKAESLEPERESLLILLAGAYRRRGRYESASGYFQRASGYKIPFRRAATATAR